MSFYNFGQQPRFGSFNVPRLTPSAALNPLGDDIFRNNKQAVFADFMRGINTTGQNAYGATFKNYANDWVQQLYPEYDADMGLGTISGDLSFRDYVNEQSSRLPTEFKYATQTRRPLARQTRFLRRF